MEDLWFHWLFVTDIVTKKGKYLYKNQARRENTNRQHDYYSVLGESDKKGSSTNFIEFMLENIQIALEDLLKSQNHSLNDIDRINVFKEIIGSREFSRQDYLRHNKDISSATASRDLKNAVENRILSKTGIKRLTKYKFD